MTKFAKPWCWEDGDQRVLLVTCPKTGNAWVKSLIANAYRILQHDYSSNAESLPDLIENMITGVGNIHPWPCERCYERAQKLGVKLLTIVRHPIRVFLSLFNQTLNNPTRAVYPETLMLKDQGQLGEGCREYLRDHFPLRLMISYGWQELGVPCIRFEDLHCNTEKTFAAVTRYIGPLPEERIFVATELSNLNVMRRLAVDDEKSHFRQGRASVCSEEIPEKILRIFKEYGPYPLLFQSLGYSLTQTVAKHSAPQPRNPFLDAQMDSNGVRIPPIVFRCFMELIPTERAKWNDVIKEASWDSFVNWVNEYVRGTPKKISNLAYFIYLIRPDVRDAFPDLFGYDWLRYCQWYLSQGRIEYELDNDYVKPMYEAFLKLG